MRLKHHQNWPFLSCVTQQMILCIRCFITTGNTEFAYGDESRVTHFLTVNYPENYLLYLHKGAGRVKCT